MLEVNLFDSEFIHTENLLGYITCSDILEPKKIKWINGKYDFNGITVFTDRYIDFNFDLVKSDLKIFWLLEPKAINPYGYSKIIEIESKFDYAKKMSGGYVNNGIYILYYDEDLTIKQEQ